jgi:hypothetical protein
MYWTDIESQIEKNEDIIYHLIYLLVLNKYRNLQLEKILD